ncbi:MAG: PepSY-associated TM helix domain-containing protein [Acidobacteria bacterium]|nr:PepSY-associated TM helix domain-containing protein [Acidobacteriota bacterium]
MRPFPRPTDGIPRRALLLVHLSTGLVVAAYAVAIGLSGAALTFRAELQTLAYPQFFDAPAEGGALADPTVVVDQLRGQYPGYRFSGITYPTPSRHSFLAYLAWDGTLRTVFADSRTGQVLGELPSDDWIQRLQDLHFTLLLGPSGYVVSGVGAACLTVLVLTGLILWWPRVTRWTEALSVHSARGWKRVVRESHWVTGVWTAGFLLLWSVSGLYFCFPGPFREAVNTLLPLTTLRPPVSTGGAAGEDVPYNQLVSRAQALVPGSQMARLVLPAAETASVGVVVARRAHGDFDTSDEVTAYFDRRTGELLALDDQSSRTVGDRVMTWLGVLHVGSFGGTPVRVLWMVTGLAFPLLAITGAVMWSTRRQKDDSRNQRAPER